LCVTGVQTCALPISFQLTLPTSGEPPKAMVLLLHGYGDHRGRYRRVADRWAEASVASAALDLRGHGTSGGVRGYCEHFRDYHQDVADMLAEIPSHTPPNVPLFAFGHSFGALVVTTFALEHPGVFQGLVLTSPHFGLALEVPKLKRTAGQVASRVYGRLALATGLCGNDLTHDESIARAYDNDPLVNKNATARWFTEASAAQRDLLARAPQLTIPLLCVQGGADHVASPSASRAVFDRVGSTDKQFDERAGLFHEVLNEPVAGDEIADQIGKWILAHA
jgi:alpha-beta hydrolase superfamily lysophospholipase